MGNSQEAARTKNRGTGGVVEATSPPIGGMDGCQRYPSSSEASKSREHPYEAYTSCQLWSSPAYISFTGPIIALSTPVGSLRGYKERNGGEVRESIPVETAASPKKREKSLPFYPIE
jgi:hypothetical protein